MDEWKCYGQVFFSPLNTGAEFLICYSWGSAASLHTPQSFGDQFQENYKRRQVIEKGVN